MAFVWALLLYGFRTVPPDSSSFPSQSNSCHLVARTQTYLVCFDQVFSRVPNVPNKLISSISRNVPIALMSCTNILWCCKTHLSSLSDWQSQSYAQSMQSVQYSWYCLLAVIFFACTLYSFTHTFSLIAFIFINHTVFILCVFLGNGAICSVFLTLAPHLVCVK